MDNILKLILIGAGVILTCVVVGVGFFISSESKGTSNAGIGQIGSLQEDQMDALSLYDGLVVSGRELVKTIEKYKGKDVYVLVKTKASTSAQGIYYNYTPTNNVLTESGTYSAETATKENKINLNGKFACTVVKNDLNVIYGLKFVQN